MRDHRVRNLQRIDSFYPQRNFGIVSLVFFVFVNECEQCSFSETLWQIQSLVRSMCDFPSPARHQRRVMDVESIRRAVSKTGLVP